MANIDRDDELQLPWCLALEADPAWERVITYSLIPQPTTESVLVAELLHNTRAIRTMRTYLRYASSKERSRSKEDLIEVCIVVSLGEGVNGNPNMCHGGITCLLLDEVTGEFAGRVLDRSQIVTATLKTTFKKPIITPTVILCRASMQGQRHGRKAMVQGSIEDGSGGIYATGEGLFIRTDKKL